MESQSPSQDQNQKRTSSILSPKVETILTDGLNSMRKACEALSDQNKILNKDIEKLKQKCSRFEEKLRINNIEV